MDLMRRLTPGEPAPDMPVFDPSGAVVSLASQWRERPSVLSFLRHFG
ncbi:MAG: hypothetical protein KAX36_08500 [Thermoflexales bacterium]|nr:hypothetical protein [Thermoflexales bacterium]